MSVDWSERSEYIWTKHQTTVEQANEALTDPDRVVLDPDPASRSGVSVRTIGYSRSRGELLRVRTVVEDGIRMASTVSNSTDRRGYREGNA